MRASYQVFRGVLQSWQSLFEEAAEAATRVGPECLIGLSHSEDRSEGVVTVWFWEDVLVKNRLPRQARFQVFRGVMTSWQALFEQACDFAGNLGRGNVIGMSHSEGKNEGVVTVWYWE